MQSLEDALNSRILVLDGAMGTMLQARNLTAADFGGAALEGWLFFARQAGTPRHCV